MPDNPRNAKTFSPVQTTSSHVVWCKYTNLPVTTTIKQSTSVTTNSLHQKSTLITAPTVKQLTSVTTSSSSVTTSEPHNLMSYKEKILNEWKNKRLENSQTPKPIPPSYKSSNYSLQSIESTGHRERPSFRTGSETSRSASVQTHYAQEPTARNIPKQHSAPADIIATPFRKRLTTQVAMDAGDEELSIHPIAEKTIDLSNRSPHTHPEYFCQDSFNRPDSPLYKPMPLPIDSVIKMNRERYDSMSSTDSEACIVFPPRVSPRMARRQQHMAAAGSDSSSKSLDTCTRYNGIVADTLQVPLRHNIR